MSVSSDVDFVNCHVGLRSLQHRSPSGYVLCRVNANRRPGSESYDRACPLVRKRASLGDPSEARHQPTTTPNPDRTMVLNREICHDPRGPAQIETMGEVPIAFATLTAFSKPSNVVGRTLENIFEGRLLTEYVEHGVMG